MDLKSTWPKLLFAGLIAVVPAVLSYCKSSQESDHARVEADAGYKALVQSVRHLELVVVAQGNALGLLTSTRLSAGSGSADPVTTSTAAALPAPNFTVLPDSTAAALLQQNAP